jgi:hypothetical protein
MPTTYRRASGTEDIGLCFHTHSTVISAVACISSAGDYIIAQEDGVFRALNKAEEAEYKYAIYGAATETSTAPLEGYRKKRFI